VYHKIGKRGGSILNVMQRVTQKHFAETEIFLRIFGDCMLVIFAEVRSAALVVLLLLIMAQ